MGRQQTIDRDGILDAAFRVMEKVGVAQLTIDAVAREAGVSKGGVLYSYGTKDALIEAMVKRTNSQYLTLSKELAADYAGRPDAALRGHIESYRQAGDETTRRAAALLASHVRSPDYDQAIRDFYGEMLLPVSAGDTHARNARHAALAAEGLFWLRGLDLIDVSTEDWEAIFHDITSLLDEL